MANTKLKEFISNVKTDGLMRSSRYTVVMAAPISMGASETNNLRQILLFCSEASIPGVNIATTPIKTFGELRETPYDKIFDNVNLTFYVDQNMHVKYFFDSWVNSIQNPQTRTFEYYNKYITDIFIQVEDPRDDSRYLVILRECYQKLISPISIGYENKEIMKLQVSMNYKYWENYKIPADPNKKTLSALDSIFKLPTLNNKELGSYLSDFSAFQTNALPEVQNFITGVTDRFSSAKNSFLSFF
jgi:hypothetical protein